MLRKFLSRLLIYAILLLGSALIIYPLFLMIITSFKTSGEVIVDPIGFPSSLRFDNYIIGFNSANIGRATINSLLYTTTSVAGIVIVSMMAAYVVSRFNFKGKTFVKLYFLSGYMIPLQVILIPLFKLIKNLNLYNNMLGVIIIYSTFPPYKY